MKSEALTVATVSPIVLRVVTVCSSNVSELPVPTALRSRRDLPPKMQAARTVHLPVYEITHHSITQNTNLNTTFILRRRSPLNRMLQKFALRIPGNPSQKPTLPPHLHSLTVFALLTSVRPCVIRTKTSATNKMQQIPFIDLLKSALHVSGNKLAHPQEHFLTVYTAFGTMN